MLDLETLVEVAREFARYGDAVGEQIESIVKSDRTPEALQELEMKGELNPNAAREYAARFLRFAARKFKDTDLTEEVEELNKAIDEYIEQRRPR